MSDLWCVHVWGPDTVIAQPSKEAAELRAKEWSEMFDRIRERFSATSAEAAVAVLMEAHVVPWPHSAELHAKGLAEHGGDPEDIC